MGRGPLSCFSLDRRKQHRHQQQQLDAHGSISSASSNTANKHLASPVKSGIAGSQHTLANTIVVAAHVEEDTADGLLECVLAQGIESIVVGRCRCGLQQFTFPCRYQTLLPLLLYTAAIVAASRLSISCW